MHRGTRTQFLAAGVALAAIFGASCGNDESDAQADAAAARVPGANLILISIDTLRADRLGCYGYDRPTSPAIDAFAARGVRFARVISESSWTLPAHATMMTGLHPATHQVNFTTDKIPEALPTLAEVLRKRGYSTHGRVAGGFVSARYGFDRGFDSYEYEMDKRGLRRMLRRARGLIRGFEPQDKYFVFLHTFDVHCPYQPRPKLAAKFKTRPPKDHIETKDRCGYTYYNSAQLTAGQAHYLSDRYDASIREADDEFGRFFRFLEERDDFDDTVVVILSDHGEEFLEHGSIGHRTLFIENLKIPWIVVSPGLAPKVVHGGTSLVDVVPTLLDLLDIEAPPSEGRSRLEVMAGPWAADPDRPLYSDLQQRHAPLRSVVDGDEHLIVNLTSRRRLLFDLSEDPREQRNLAKLHPASAKRLAAVLEARPTIDLTAEPAAAGQLTAEETKRLRALGYLN